MPFKLFGLGKRPLRGAPFPTVGFFALSQLIFAHWDSSHPGVPLFPSPLFFGSLITFSVLGWDSGHYHIVLDHSRPVENCADWTTRKSGAFSLLNSGTKPGLPGDHGYALRC